MRKLIVSLILSASLFRASSQTLDESKQELQKLASIRVVLSDSIEKINSQIDVLQKKILYLEYKEGQVLDSRFISKTKTFGSPYMMTGAKQDIKVDLENSATVELLDYDGKKLKVFANDRIGFIWPGDIENQLTVEQFIRLIEGKKITEGTDDQSSSQESTNTPSTTTQQESISQPAKTTTNGNSYPSKTSRNYHRGPRGGCYYYNSSGNKVYVDRSLCN